MKRVKHKYSPAIRFIKRQKEAVYSNGFWDGDDFDEFINWNVRTVRLDKNMQPVFTTIKQEQDND